MKRYIDADALEVVCFTDREGSFSDGVQWLLEYIDGLPPADVQPVLHGHWEKDPISKRTRCSECYSVVPRDDYRRECLSDYCSVCGARMDGEQDVHSK